MQLFDTIVDVNSSDLDKVEDPQMLVSNMLNNHKSDFICREVNRLHLPLDFYFVIRVIGILRNLVNAFALKLAISEVWEDIASKVNVS